MKKLSIACLILLSLLVTTVGFSQNYPSEYDGPSDDKYYEADDDDRAGNDRYSYEEFYDQLSPYGSWVNYPQYGYVWVPRVSQDFHPYATEGHWAMTNYGWTWVSDYRWGWAAFHYGRWAYEPRFGWMWLPGRKWGPAWVSWRESNDYFGWAPLGPFGRIAINVSCPNDHFRFVQRRYFTDRNISRYYSDRRDNITIINRSRYINETHTVNRDKYFYGPRKDHVEHAVGQSIRVANVSTRQKPDADFSDNDNVKVYRPRFDNAPTDGGHRASPKKVANVTEMADVPTDKRLTPNVRMEKPQNMDGTSRGNREGGQSGSQGRQPRRDESAQSRSDGSRQELPNSEPRPQRQPRKDEATQGRSDAARQEVPNSEPRPQRQPRREETTQGRPDVTRQQVPNSEPRPQRQPRREETTQGRPDATRQQVPNSEPRPQRQAQREENTQGSTPNNQQKVEQPRRERVNPQPANEKQAAPNEKRNRERGN